MGLNSYYAQMARDERKPQKDKYADNEQLPPSLEGRTKYLSKHALDRYVERYGGKRKEVVDQINKILDNAIAKLRWRFNDKAGHYLVHSLTTRIGIAISFEPSVKGGPNNVVVKTLLPKASTHQTSPKNPDEQLMLVEKLILEMFDKEFLTESAKKEKYSIVRIHEDWDVILKSDKVFYVGLDIIAVD